MRINIYFTDLIKRFGKWQIVAILALFFLVLSSCILIAVLNDSDSSDNNAIGIQTELENVQLAVYSFMANPHSPIYSLDGSDTRIVGIVQCGDDYRNPLALTQNMNDGGLVDICITAECVASQGTPHPVSEFLMTATTECWYCIQNDGKVWGYEENCIADEGIDCDAVHSSK